MNTKNPLGIDELLKTVYFDTSFLDEFQRKNFDDSMKIMKGKPSQFFAPASKRDEINALFEESAEYIARYFTYKDMYSSTYSKEQLFINNFNYYTSWVSIIGRRFKSKKIFDMEGLKMAYIDVINKAIKKDFHQESPQNLKKSDLPSGSNIYWDKPEDDVYRKIAHGKGLVPSSYGAANPEELFATAVEQAVMDKYNPKLKAIIQKTVYGY